MSDTIRGIFLLLLLLLLLLFDFLEITLTIRKPVKISLESK